MTEEEDLRLYKYIALEIHEDEQRAKILEAVGPMAALMSLR